MMMTMRGTLAVMAAQCGMTQAEQARLEAQMDEILAATRPEPEPFQEPPSEE